MNTVNESQHPPQEATGEDAPLPAGTVTFLMTDVEGSVRLWEESSALMRRALARHDALAGAITARHGGRQIKSRGEGDSLFLVFPAVGDALRAACALQQAYGAEPWPTAAPLRVRMALHAGEAEQRDGDYYGGVVNRCARLRSAAHGGQVLLTAMARDRVGDDLPPEAALRDLGPHRLRDLGRPQQVYQLLHPALPAAFPPLRSLDDPALPNNLPLQLTSFVGRDKELAEVKALLGRTRLLTVIGGGGGGKTRLCLQVAADLLDDSGEGAWLVELAALHDPALVPQAVADALGVREEPGRPILQTLTDALGAKRRLILLDNCEHLLPACAALAGALGRHCPHVRLLASSREALGVAGEQTYRIPPLSLPSPKEAQAEDVSGSEAVRLFVERAHLVQPAFAITDGNAVAVAEVCRRLDGIPLAIELAAARVRVLAVEQIRVRVDDRFRLLTGGSRTALPRQQTLRALIDWSYDLLDAREKALLRRLSVFTGGWTLAAAEAVGAGADIMDWDVLDLLTSLVDKSLAVYDEDEAGESRYRLLETVRHYAADKLGEVGEDAAARGRHRDWFLGLAEEAAPNLRGPQQVQWLDRLEADYGNLRAALDWCLARGAGGAGNAETGLRLASLLSAFWLMRGHLAEGRAVLDACLSLPGASEPTLARANALHSDGILATAQVDPPRAQALHEESLALFRRVGDQEDVAGALENLGIVSRLRGDLAGSRALLEESLAMRRRLEDPASLAMCLVSLGALLGFQGDFAGARALLEESLATHRRLEDPRSISLSLLSLGSLAARQGDLGRARALLRECLPIQSQLKDTWTVTLSLDWLALVFQGEGQVDRSARLHAAAEALYAAIGVPMSPILKEARDRSVAAAHDALGPEAFSSAWEEGRQMAWEQAVEYALAAG